MQYNLIIATVCIYTNHFFNHSLGTQMSLGIANCAYYQLYLFKQSYVSNIELILNPLYY